MTLRAAAFKLFNILQGGVFLQPPVSGRLSEWDNIVIGSGFKITLYMKYEIKVRNHVAFILSKCHAMPPLWHVSTRRVGPGFTVMFMQTPTEQTSTGPGQAPVTYTHVRDGAVSFLQFQLGIVLVLLLGSRFLLAQQRVRLLH